MTLGESMYILRTTSSCVGLFIVQQKILKCPSLGHESPGLRKQRIFVKIPTFDQIFQTRKYITSNNLYVLYASQDHLNFEYCSKIWGARLPTTPTKCCPEEKKNISDRMFPLKPLHLAHR